MKQLAAVLTHHVSSRRCAELRGLGVPVLVMTGGATGVGERLHTLWVTTKVSNEVSFGYMFSVLNASMNC